MQRQCVRGSGDWRGFQQNTAEFTPTRTAFVPDNYRTQICQVSPPYCPQQVLWRQGWTLDLKNAQRARKFTARGVEGNLRFRGVPHRRARIANQDERWEVEPMSDKMDVSIEYCTS